MNTVKDLSVQELHTRFWQNRYDFSAIRNERRHSGTDIKEARALLLQWQAELRTEARRRISDRPTSFGSALGQIASGWRNRPAGAEHVLTVRELVP